MPSTLNTRLFKTLAAHFLRICVLMDLYVFSKLTER